MSRNYNSNFDLTYTWQCQITLDLTGPTEKSQRFQQKGKVKKNQVQRRNLSLKSLETSQQFIQLQLLTLIYGSLVRMVDRWDVVVCIIINGAAAVNSAWVFTMYSLLAYYYFFSFLYFSLSVVLLVWNCRTIFIFVGKVKRYHFTTVIKEKHK